MTGTYVELRGVRTWYDERGSGQPLVRLHGLTDARFFEQNIGPLAERFDDAFATDQRGHGHTADVEGPIIFDVMAQDTTAFLEDVVGRPAQHRDGGIIRRHLAALARCRLSGDFSETLSALAKHAER
jgi:pimeloyl-ACP methyl ester carboxylesterase